MPSSSTAEVVAELCACGDRHVDLGEHFVTRDSCRPHEKAQACDLGAPHCDLITSDMRTLLSLLQELLCFREPPSLDEGAGQLRYEFETTPIVERQQCHGAHEQLRRGGHIAACQRAQAGRGETFRRTFGESSRLAGSSELGMVSVGLFEVVAEDLLILAHAIGDHSLEPPCEALVQIGSELFWHRRVGGISYQDVVEAESIIACEQRLVGVDEVLPRQ